MAGTVASGLGSALGSTRVPDNDDVVFGEWTGRSSSWDIPGSRAALRLLGGFDLEYNGRPLKPARTECHLLALLGIHDGPLSRAYVARMLWPRIDAGRAATRLRSVLYRLRRLAPGILGEAVAERLQLSDHMMTDVRVLARWARDVVAGDGLVGPADAHPTVSFGVLLPGWGEDWVLLHRERLRQLRLCALEALAARLTAAGRYDEAAAAGWAAVEACPLRESAQRALINAYGAAGRLDAVMRQYHQYRQSLQRELGLEPSPHLQKTVATLGCLPHPTVTHS